MILFKAQGTFQGSKPGKNSPYPTAGPFFSNSILGQQIWPGNTSIESIHHRLSTSLNDRHNRIGIVGDWRETHARQFGGYWSFHWERFEKITNPGQKTVYRVLQSERQDSG
jgi:hypothetical protein